MEKRNKMKFVVFLDKRNQRNANAQELKKAQRELKQTKKNNSNTFKFKSIKSGIRFENKQS